MEASARGAGRDEGCARSGKEENDVFIWTKRLGLTDRRDPTFGAQEGPKKWGKIWGNNERPGSFSFSQRTAGGTLALVVQAR